jgi:hypothetical protein
MSTSEMNHELRKAKTLCLENPGNRLALEGYSDGSGILENGQPNVELQLESLKAEGEALISRLQALSGYVGTVATAGQTQKENVDEARAILQRQLIGDVPGAKHAKQSVQNHFDRLGDDVAATAGLQKSIEDGTQALQEALGRTFTTIEGALSL